VLHIGRALPINLFGPGTRGFSATLSREADVVIWTCGLPVEGGCDGKEHRDFSDGTGQGSGMPKEERSNVWKLWNATKHAAPKDQQITFYDEGLGAEHKKEWWRWGYDLLSKATGLGISQNIKDCYVALIEFYEPGDRVFLFGFSRGAYTIRSLGGVLSLCGIPRHDRNVRTAANASKGDREAAKSVRTAVAEEAVKQDLPALWQ
jgi:hypothetical protein